MVRWHPTTVAGSKSPRHPRNLLRLGRALTYTGLSCDAPAGVTALLGTNCVRLSDGGVRPRYGGDGGRENLIEHFGEASTAIEAPLELGEVARHILPADGVERAGDCGLQIAEHGIDPTEAGKLLRKPDLRTDDTFVAAAGFGDTREAGKASETTAAVGAR
jgi:hypothetical protein